LPDFNLCIEYDGEQHFRKRRDDKYGNNIKLQIFRDNIKTNFCLKNNIKLKRITYKENVSVELKKLFSELNIKEIYSFSDSVLKFINKDRKKCSVCHSVKKLEKFHKSSRMLDGHKSQCKECVKMMSKRYRKNKKMYD
ncbi:MAG: hypothetical protein KC589_08515, partial [Nanoarchaeota archaeon]|nr:hypothetical protein [Nanoarchaeota archaeon]